MYRRFGSVKRRKSVARVHHLLTRVMLLCSSCSPFLSFCFTTLLLFFSPPHAPLDLLSSTEITTGERLDVKPSKVVAGLEADKTNRFLQNLAKAAIDFRDSPATAQPLVSGNKVARDTKQAKTTKTGKAKPSLDVRQKERVTDSASEAHRLASSSRVPTKETDDKRQASEPCDKEPQPASASLIANAETREAVAASLDSSQSRQDGERYNPEST